jgi:hypothetical protein
MDETTGEIFLTDFFRNNTFKGPQRGQQALGDFRQIESEALRKRILKAVAESQECGLSVEFLTGFVKNQQLKNQGKDQGEVKVKTTPPTPPAGVDLEELVAAATWEIKQKGKEVGIGLAEHIISRVKREGMSPRDWSTLEAFKSFKEKAATRFHQAPQLNPRRPKPQGMGSLSEGLNPKTLRAVAGPQTPCKRERV